MFPDQFRNFRIGLAVFTAVVFGGMWAYLQFSQRRAVERRVAASVEPMPGATDSPRLVRWRSLRSTDPGAAVALADEILAKPQSAEERGVVQLDYRSTLARAFSQQLQAGKISAAKVWQERLEKSYPEAAETKQVRVEWTGHLVGEVSQAIERGDEASAEAALTALLAEPVDAANENAFLRWAQQHEKEWRVQLAGQPAEAARHLIAAAIVVTDAARLQRFASIVATTVELPFEALTTQGNALAGTPRRHGAILLWQAQVMRLEKPDYDAAVKRMTPAARTALAGELRRRIAAAWQDLGDRLHGGERPAFVRCEPRLAYAEAAVVLRDRPEEAAALAKQIEFEAAELARSAAPVTSLALTDLLNTAEEQRKGVIDAARNAHRRAREIFDGPGLRLWQRVLERPGVDPWPLAPVAAVESISAALPEMERRKQLLAYYRRQSQRVPLTQLTPVAAVYYSAGARGGLVGMLGGVSDAHEVLREVLRDAGDPELTTGIAGALRARMTTAAAKDEFERLYVLAGFYAAEVGFPTADDPWREQFRTVLVKARDNFRRTNSIKHMFMNALLAECFAHEDLGEQAREEAIKTAFVTVARRSATVDHGEAHLPSLVPGLSLHRVDNATPYHLLMFYRGPERFMVHSRPWRRGVSALASGDYEIAVICPDGAIEPYYGRVTLKDGTRLSDYHIETVRDSGPAAFPSTTRADGNYEWLRRAPAVQRLTLDPRTGLVAPATK